MVETETPTEDEVVQCDHCGALVERKATQPVSRSYMGRSFAELWCVVCKKNVDDNTRRALQSLESEQSPSELGLDE